MEDIWVEKFEGYLQNKLSAEEKREFEAQLASDQDLREAFSVFRTIEKEMRYRSTSENETVALKSTLEKLRKKHLKNDSQTIEKTIPFFAKKRNIYYSGIAAALVIFFVSFAVFLGSRPANMHKTANDYFASNLQELGQTMGGIEDSLQLGIAAYNQGEFTLAQTYFEAVLLQQPSNAEALKNLGLAHLSKNEFELALHYFERLSQRSDLMANSGQFLQALTLLIRNDSGDLEKAKKNLEVVVDQQSEGQELAKKWIEKMD